MKKLNLNSRLVDAIIGWLVVFGLLVSAAMLFNATIGDEDLGAWVWGRHQNQFSWYSRPLFIIPACYYAFRQRLWFVIGFMLLLGCSLFWFSAPEIVPAHVADYLAWEKQLFFTNQSLFPLVLLVVVVIAFLYGLFHAFWQRSPWIGLLLINVGTLIKVVVSVVYGKDAGMAAIVPSLSSLIVINFIAVFVWKYRYAR